MLITVPIVIAAYWVYSNTVNYDPALTEPTLSVDSSAGREVTLKVTGVNDGATVYFGTTSGSDKADDSDFAVLGLATANSAGEAVYSYTLPDDNAVYFSARVQNTELT